MDNQGVYLEVVPGEKLVFTDAYTEGWKPAPEPFMTAILLLADAPGGGTTYTAIARHRNPETPQVARGDGLLRRLGHGGDAARGLCQGPDAMSGRFATLTFEREVAAPVATLWQAWTAPAARAVWAAPDARGHGGVPRGRHPGGRARGLALQGGGAARHPLRGRLAGAAARGAQRELRGDLVRGRDAIGGAGDGGFRRRGRRQPGGGDGAALLAGRGHGGRLPAGLRRRARQSGGRGRADHGAAAGDQGAAAGGLGRLDEPRDPAANGGGRTASPAGRSGSTCGPAANGSST